MSWIPYLTMFLLALVGLMLIFIILLQRGRGGGLAGALGGMGGQSAFGTKAGDVFTRITVVLAIIWVLLAAGNVYALRGFGGPKFKGGADAVPVAPGFEAKDGEKKSNEDLNISPNNPTAPADPGASKPDPAAEKTPQTEAESTDAKTTPDAAAKPDQPETPVEKPKE
jgi:preprotein translocase subunit SecG